jgi:hypothetical protein
MNGDLSRERLTALRILGGRTDVASVADAVRVFRGERDLLLAVHYRWQLNLLARLDQVLETATDDIHGDVLRAVENLGRSLPGFAALLRGHARDPVLDRARRRLAGYVDQACPCGRPHPVVPAAARRGSTEDCERRHVRALAAGWQSALRQLRTGRTPCGLGLGRA